MIKSIGTALFAMLCSTTIINAADVTAVDLAVEPSLYIGTEVTVRNIGCIEQIEAGYLCVGKAEGRLLAIDAVILGDKTSIDLSEIMHEKCFGTSNLDSLSCKFDATFTPATSQLEKSHTRLGDVALTRIYVKELNVVSRNDTQ